MRPATDYSNHNLILGWKLKYFQIVAEIVSGNWSGVAGMFLWIRLQVSGRAFHKLASCLPSKKRQGRKFISVKEKKKGEGGVVGYKPQ